MKQITSNSSLSRRFSFATIMVVTSILLAACILAIAYSINKSEADMKNRLDSIIGTAQASMSFSLWNLQSDVVKAHTDILSKEKGVAFIQIRDEDGELIAQTPAKGDFSFLDEKNAGDRKKFFLYNESDIIFLQKEEKKKWKVGLIRVAIDKRVFQSELLTNIMIIIAMTIAIIIAISITSIIITKRHIFRPLSKLETSAELIAKGKLDTVIDAENDDEIGKLSRSFDRTRLSLKKLVGDLKSANKRLDESNKTLEQRVKDRTVELEKAKDEAERINKTLNMFIANMSHEIRTPMHVILSYTDLLERRLTGEEEKKYLTVINSNSNMLLQLLNGILDLSKIKVGKLELINEPMDIRATLADIKRSFLIKVEEKKLDFNIKVDPAFPSVIYFDATRLNQLIFNLAGNAVKFTDSGYVTLEVKICSTREEDSTIDFSITVEDTGRGIDKAKLEKIFDYFVQEDDSISFNYGGAGLGLSISKELVNLMNGTIQAKSNPGKGSCFRIDFRNIKTKMEEKETEKNQSIVDVESIVFEKKTILVVEDVKDIRESFRLYLEDYDLEIIEAENGEQGIKLAKKHHPHLIIMDIKMPGMSGFEALKRIKEDTDLEDIPVIAFTAHALKEEEEKIMALGFNGFLRKPAGRIQVIIELARHLPHTVKESTASIPPVSDSTGDEFLLIKDRIPSIPRENIPPLIKALETKFLGKWRDIQKSLIINNAKDFAKQIKELGTHFNAEILIKWADRILTDIRLVNINKVSSSIALFPKIVELIKSNNQSQPLNGEKNERQSPK